MLDQHVHSTYSEDGKNSIEDFIKNTNDKILTFTDHYEFYSPSRNHNNFEYKIKEQKEEMRLLEKQYDVSLYQGVEIGYSKYRINDIKELIRTNKFDIVLLSVHHYNDGIFYKEIPGKTDKEVLEYYYDIIQDALNQDFDIDVITHLDYPTRTRDITLALFQTVEEKLKEIFKTMIKQNITFEINTKSIYLHNRYDIYNYMIDLYLQMGGKDVMINSDAHAVKHYKYQLNQTVDLLLSKGVTEVSYYIKREKHKMTLKKY